MDITPYNILAYQGRRTKIDQGEKNFFGPAREARAKILPLSDFPPPGHDFWPPHFYFFISLKWPSL